MRSGVLLYRKCLVFPEDSKLGSREREIRKVKDWEMRHQRM